MGRQMPRKLWEHQPGQETRMATSRNTTLGEKREDAESVVGKNHQMQTRNIRNHLNTGTNVQKINTQGGVQRCHKARTLPPGKQSCNANGVLERSLSPFCLQKSSLSLIVSFPGWSTSFSCSSSCRILLYMTGLVWDLRCCNFWRCLGQGLLESKTTCEEERAWAVHACSKIISARIWEQACNCDSRACRSEDHWSLNTCLQQERLEAWWQMGCTGKTSCPKPHQQFLQSVLCGFELAIRCLSGPEHELQVKIYQSQSINDQVSFHYG